MLSTTVRASTLLIASSQRLTNFSAGLGTPINCWLSWQFMVNQIHCLLWWGVVFVGAPNRFVQVAPNNLSHRFQNASIVLFHLSPAISHRFQLEVLTCHHDYSE